jgi:hypothetical protein
LFQYLCVWQRLSIVKGPLAGTTRSDGRSRSSSLRPENKRFDETQSLKTDPLHRLYEGAELQQKRKQVGIGWIIMGVFVIRITSACMRGSSRSPRTSLRARKWFIIVYISHMFYSVLFYFIFFFFFLFFILSYFFFFFYFKKK